MTNYSFVQYSSSMKLPDTIYNGRYNKEPAIIRIEYGIPTWVQFCSFLKDTGDGQEEVRRSCIFDPNGILHSSVELLLPAQEI